MPAWATQIKELFEGTLSHAIKTYARIRAKYIPVDRSGTLREICISWIVKTISHRAHHVTFINTSTEVTNIAKLNKDTDMNQGKCSQRVLD